MREYNMLLKQILSSLVTLIVCTNLFSAKGQTQEQRNNRDSKFIDTDLLARTIHRRSEYVGHSEGVLSVCLNSSGDRIFTGSQDNTAIIWDRKSGIPLHRLQGHKGNVVFLAVDSTDCRLLTGSDDGTVLCWDIETGNQLSKLDTRLSTVEFFAASSDFETIVTDGENWAGAVAIVWDFVTGKQRKVIEGDAKNVNCLTLSHDSKNLAVGMKNGSIILYDVETGRKLKEFSNHFDKVNSLVFTKDGKSLLSASEDNNAVLTDCENGKPLNFYGRHRSPVFSAVFNFDETKVLTNSADKTSKISETRTSRPLQELVGHDDWVFTGAFGKGDLVVTGSLSKYLPAIVWEPNSRRIQFPLVGKFYSVSAVRFEPGENHLFVGCFDNSVTMWDTNNGKLIKKFCGHSKWIRSIAIFGGGSRLLSGSDDETAVIWNTKSGAKLRTSKDFPYQVENVDASDEQGIILIQSLSELFVSNIDNGNLICKLLIDKPIFEQMPPNLLEPTNIVSSCISKDGNLVAAGLDNGFVVIWNLKSSEKGRAIRIAASNYVRVNSIKFSPDAKLLVAGLGGVGNTGIVMDAITGKIENELVGHKDDIDAVVFGPIGHTIATGSADGSAILWNVESGKRLKTLIGHQLALTSIDFSIDGKKIVTGSHDTTAIIWDVETGKALLLIAPD